MADFRIKTSWRKSRKRKRLKRKLGAEGVLAVEDLWAYCAEERTNGDLCGLTHEDIADEADWDGDPGDFVDTLVDLRLLDGMPGAYRIHDWDDHNPYVASSEERSNQASEARHIGWHKAGKHKHTPKADCPLCKTENNESNTGADTPETNRSTNVNGASTPSPYPSPSPSPNSPSVSPPQPYAPTASGSEPLGAEAPRKNKPPAKQAKSAKDPRLREQVQRVVDYYRSQHPQRGKHLRPGHRDWEKFLEPAVKNHGVDECLLAIDGNLLDRWHAEKRKHSIEFVFRNSTKIEDFANMARDGPPLEGNVGAMKRAGEAFIREPDIKILPGGG